jgi:hypothetical protein
MPKMLMDNTSNIDPPIFTPALCSNCHIQLVGSFSADQVFPNCVILCPGCRDKLFNEIALTLDIVNRMQAVYGLPKN